jgi:hypothetical protein
MNPEEFQAFQALVHERFAKGIERMDAIEQMMLENQKASAATAAVVAENMAITKEMKDAFDLAKTGLRVIGVLGTVAKWVATIAGALAAVWATVYGSGHGGKPL